MRHRHLIICASLASLFVAAQVFAYEGGYSIGINFTSERTGPNVLQQTDVAGLPSVRQANWNNSEPPGASGTIIDLRADDHAAVVDTIVTVTWTCPNTWTSTGGGEENNAFPAGPDRILMTGYLDTGAATTTQVTINNLPPDLTASGYDVYVYFLGGVTGRGGGYRVTDSGGNDLTGYKLGDSAASPSTYIEDPGASHTDTGNYVVFRGFTAPDIIVEATTAGGLGSGGVPRAPINAIQLVASTLDIIPPSVPGNLRAPQVGARFVDLAWNASTDNSIDPITYELDRDGTIVARVTSTTYRDMSVKPEMSYTYQVRAVDSSNNRSDFSTPLPVTTVAEVERTGTVKDELYTGLSTATVGLADLLADPNFPDNPGQVLFRTGPEGPVNYLDGYGSRLSGWFTPPENAGYVFFLSADDNAELYLSTDASPANKLLIATETIWSNSRDWVASAGASDNTAKRSDQFAGSQWVPPNTITLNAGTKYYFEALMKEGGGGDNLGIFWMKAGDPDPQNGDAPVTGPWFSTPCDPTGASLAITQQPADTTATVGTPATFSVTATGTSPYATGLSYQWYRDGVPIRNANSATFTTPAEVTDADNGAKFRCYVAMPCTNILSAEATLTVIADTVPPKITGVVATSTERLEVTFNEPIDSASAGLSDNYQVSGGVAVSSATAAARSVVLATSPLTVGNIYTLTVGGVKDRFNNAVPAGTTFTFVVRLSAYADVILADEPIAFYRFEEETGPSTANLGTFGPAGDGLWMVGASAGEASTEAGPRPPQFLGFAANNRAASFGGTAAQRWVDTQNQFLNNLAAFSLEYWVRPLNRAGWSRIGVVGQNDAVEYGFIAANTIQIWTPAGGSLDTAYTFPDGEWHHVATIASGTDLRNYFDGILVGTGGIATANYGSSGFNVHIGGGGVFDGTGNFFNGQIDEVAIFDKAIPAERIAAHYQAGKEGEPPPTLSISLSSGQVTIGWDLPSVLEEALAVTGPWATSANQANPQTRMATGTMFFRLRR
jgi:chitodextrinase